MDALAVITTVAGVIKTAVDIGPTVIKTIDDAKPFAEALYRALTGNEITGDQLAELEVRIAALSAELQQPLPPAQPGDPDYVG